MPDATETESRLHTLSLGLSLAGFVALIGALAVLAVSCALPAEPSEPPAAVRFAVEHGGGDVLSGSHGEVLVVGDAATGLCYAVYVYYYSGVANLGPVPCE